MRKSKLTKNQKINVPAKRIEYYGEPADMLIAIQYDDECGNGHNTFSIIGDIYKAGKRGGSAYLAGGCLHDEIKKHAPEYAHLIKWHLMNSDSPMHYVANALYHASDRDYKGKRKGEPTRFDTRIKFGDFPLTYKSERRTGDFVQWLRKLDDYDLEIVGIEHEDRKMFKTKYTFAGYTDKWHECPFDTKRDAGELLEALNNYAVEFVDIPVAWSEGKEPDLGAARIAAKWPDAELEDFTEEKLQARIPAMIEEFAGVIESLGMEY